MNEFDDRELGDALRRRAGDATDGFGIEAARSAVVARAMRVRRRRAAVAGGAAMAGLIVAAVLVVGPGTDSVVTTPSDSSNGSAPAPVDTLSDVTAFPTDPDRTASDHDAIDTTPPADTSPGPATTVPVAVPPTGTASSTSAPATTAPAVPGTTVVPPPTTPQPTSPTTATTPAPGPGPTTDSYSSAGGSITVRWDGTVLDLQYATPAAGFEAEVEDDRPDRVRVRFRGDAGDVRIELRVENGEVVRVE
jgi:hypothetical protein